MENNKIPTAEEFLKNKKYPPYTENGGLGTHYVKDAMIHFARLHVKAALQKASEKAEANFEPMGWLAEQHLSENFKEGEDYEIGISRESILQSYPENLIK